MQIAEPISVLPPTAPRPTPAGEGATAESLASSPDHYVPSVGDHYVRSAGDRYVPSFEAHEERDSSPSHGLPDLGALFGQDGLTPDCAFVQGRLQFDRDVVAREMAPHSADYSRALENLGVTFGSGQDTSPGTLFVDDTFTVQDPAALAEPRSAAHGYTVAEAARDHGFTGPIVGSQSLPNLLAVGGMQSAEQTLRTPGLDQEAALSALDMLVTNSAGGLLDQKARVLDGLTCDGVNGSAVNFSQGTSPARIVGNLYREIEPVLSGQTSSLDPASLAQREAMLANLGTAFSVDPQALSSDDQTIRQQAQQSLVQGLVDRVSQAFDSPWVAGSEQRYEAAVGRFEAANNSVVVSAGNEGLIAPQLTQAIGDLSFPEGFDRNVLDAGGATAVGATRWFANGGELEERLATYSNPAEVYASGSVATAEPEVAGALGSSFASPRLAAVLAQVHGQNPDLSSDQAVTQVQEEMTHPLPTSEGEVLVLDYSRVYEFLQTR